MKVTFRFDTKDLERGLTALRRKFPRVVWRAVRRAGVSARTVMAKEIRKDMALPAKQIKSSIKMTPIKHQGGSPTGIRLEVTGRRIPLIAFKARQTRRGVSYRLPGGRRRAPSAFIATIAGRVGVFARKGAARTPTRELHGPSVVRVFEKFLPLGAERGRVALVKNLRSEIAFATRSKK